MNSAVHGFLVDRILGVAGTPPERDDWDWACMLHTAFTQEGHFASSKETHCGDMG